MNVSECFTETKLMYMSDCMYMSECKIFPFFTFRYRNLHTAHTDYNCTETFQQSLSGIRSLLMGLLLQKVAVRGDDTLVCVISLLCDLVRMPCLISCY